MVSQLAYGNSVERPLEVLRDRLRRLRLPDARGPEEVDDEAMSSILLRYDFGAVSLYKAPERVSLVLWQYETRQRILGPLNRADLRDAELH